MRPRVAVIVEKPIQFYAPHYRHVAKDGRVDLIVLYLTNRGVKPHIYSGARVTQESSVLEGYPYKMLRNYSPFPDRLGFGGDLALGLWHELRSGGYAAAYFHGYSNASCWIGFLACMRAGIPILLRGESEEFFRRPWHRRLVKRLVLHLLFRRVAAFLYIGTWNREFYLSYGVSEDRLFAVPYGVDNAWFRGSEEERSAWRKRVRGELGLSEKTMVFVYASKHRRPKRPDDAVAAFCELPPELDAALIMLGDGDLRGVAERVFRDRGRGHRVYFVGLKPYSELRMYLAGGDVFVFPSIENWGMAVNEAIASGLAVLCSDQVAGSCDTVKPGVNGFLFPAGSISSLAERMRALLTRRDLVATMGRESLRIAEGMGLDRMTDGLAAAVDYVSRGAVKKAGSRRRREVDAALEPQPAPGAATDRDVATRARGLPL